MPELKPRTGESGFTLIELVMVIVIGTVAMYPLLSMIMTATENAPIAELTTKAVFLSQGKMETVVADFYSPSRGYSYVTNANYPDEASVAGFTGFARTVTVSADSTYDGVTFKMVTVTVTHNVLPDITIDTWVTQ